MNEFFKRTWAEINLDHLRHNVQVIRQTLSPQTKMMAVVKADAYGHGDAAIARELSRMGVDWFCVSNLEEALSLRSAGITGEILILGITPVQYCQTLAEQKITQTVFSEEYAEKLNEAAASRGVTVLVHIKLDTGMGRIGFAASRKGNDTAAEFLSRCRSLLPTGIFSHFSHADSTEGGAQAYTLEQVEKFNCTVASFRRYFPKLATHLQNSAGIMDYQSLHYDLVRPGIILYGIAPSDNMGSSLDLKPVMELKSIVAMVKNVGPGEAIGYSRAFTATKPMRVATIPVGYADGYARRLGGQGEVLLHGKRARVLGNVCMDQIMVDVTDIPQAAMGDIVTLFGRDGEAFIPVEELASKVGTIPYETVCLISKRVPRVYYREGSIVDVFDGIA